MKILSYSDTFENSRSTLKQLCKEGEEQAYSIYHLTILYENYLDVSPS